MGDYNFKKIIKIFIKTITKYARESPLLLAYLYPHLM